MSSWDMSSARNARDLIVLAVAGSYVTNNTKTTAVESHICQSWADMGHPSFVTNRELAVGNPRFPAGSVRNAA
jgi:hypothetical protein